MRDAYPKFCRVCWYSGKCLRFALAGSFKSATNWAGVIGAGLLAFGLQRYSHKLMPGEEWHEIIAQGLLYIVAAWVVIFVVRLIIAPFMVYRDGQFFGRRFVYREPKLAFHTYVSPADNNRDYVFRFPDAPPYSFIRYNIVLDGRADFISAQVACTPIQLTRFTSHNDVRYTSGGIRVNRRRDMCMRTFMRENATPFSVRIYVTGWEEGPANDDYRAADRPDYSGLALFNFLR